jgi:hypothetical protein
MAAAAIAKARRVAWEEHAGLIGRVYGHEQPLLPLRYFQKNFDQFAPGSSLPPSDAEQSDESEEFYASGPAEIETYYQAVNLRARTFFGMLQSGQVVTLGHTADGHLVSIAHSIWSHEDYYIHVPTGDVYEAGFGEMAKKWTAVIFRQPSAPSDAAMFHVQPPIHDNLRLLTMGPVLEAKGSIKKALARVETTGAARKACVAWLTEIMRGSPHERTESVTALWKMALEKWPNNLSHRSFVAARTEAIRASGAIVWATAGAPKKPRGPQSPR